MWENLNGNNDLSKRESGLNPAAGHFDPTEDKFEAAASEAETEMASYSNFASSTPKPGSKRQVTGES